jgi:hypothetical protein
MARVYVTAVVPAAARGTAEALVAPYLVSPNAPGVYTFGVPITSYPGDPSAEPTHYGCCAAMDDTGGLYQAMPALAEAVPGTVYAVVSPWRTFKASIHWIGWLNGMGLQPRIEPT